MKDDFQRGSGASWGGFASVKLCWSQMDKLGEVESSSLFVLVSGMSILFYLTWRITSCSVCTMHWTVFSLDERSVTPSAIRSSQWRLLCSRVPGCSVELCFLCLQFGPSCYYTTASASPATTNIPTTTAVSTTVKSSVLVGKKQSWINTESKGGIFIWIILSYRYL